jgi:hypothetical protein
MKLTSLTLEPMIFILLLTFIHQSKEDKSSLVDITDVDLQITKEDQQVTKEDQQVTKQDQQVTKQDQQVTKQDQQVTKEDPHVSKENLMNLTTSSTWDDYKSRMGNFIELSIYAKRNI